MSVVILSLSANLPHTKNLRLHDIHIETPDINMKSLEKQKERERYWEWERRRMSKKRKETTNTQINPNELFRKCIEYIFELNGVYMGYTT